MIKHVSNSMLGLHARCEVAFEYSYLAGLKIPGTAAMYRGSAVHKAAEINHKQKIVSGEDLPCDDLKDACRDSFVARCKSGIWLPKEDRSRKNSILNNELNLSIKDTEGYSSMIAPKIMPAYAEKRISYDFGLDLPLLGILDVVDDKNVIIDLKSVTRKKTKGWERKETQPSMYTLLWEAYTGSKAEFKYFVIKEGDVSEQEATRNEADCNQLLERIKIFIKSVQSGIFKPAEPGHWLCNEKWCGYWPICKYAQR